MELKDIIAISGKPGLFEIKAQAKNRIIASSLINGKKIPVMALNTVSSLNEISIYSIKDDLPLAEVFKSMHIHKESISVVAEDASDEELKSYFKKVVPNYDENRVYASNIKKIVQWFHLLEKNNFDFSKIDTEQEASNEETTNETVKEEVSVEEKSNSES